MKHNLHRQNFEKISNTKFHENPSSENRVIRYGGTDTKKDKKMLTGAVGSFAKALKKFYLSKEINRPELKVFPNILMRIRTTEAYPCPQRDSNPKSLLLSGFRPTP
jgi:hypothetical protein